MKPALPALVALFICLHQVAASQPVKTAAVAVNTLGIELLRGVKTSNTILSPYSLESAMAMAYAGSDGETRREMGKVLHYAEGKADIPDAQVALHRQIAALAENPASEAGQSNPSQFTFTTVNALFAQSGYGFREEFLKTIKKECNARFVELDFKSAPNEAEKQINEWARAKTNDRVNSAVPPGSIHALSRLIAVNAVYLNARWEDEFHLIGAPRPYTLNGGEVVKVPTLAAASPMGYVKRTGFQAITIPYAQGDCHMLIVLPDKPNGLPQLENRLTGALLQELADAKSTEVHLTMPKLSFDPPGFEMAGELNRLGMKRAFDQTPGAANFERMLSHPSAEPWSLSGVYQKVFLKVDEKGTEAAAVTSMHIVMMGISKEQKPSPKSVRVDHPFLFAIQHRPTGVCLFLGRVNDPR